MDKRIIFLVFFFTLFLFSLNFISAATPQEPNPDGLSIQFSEIDTIKQNTDHSFNFHVINATQVLTNETTTCDFDMFSPNGDKLFDSILDFRNANEFYVDVEGGNFSELGQHSYITSCNNSLQAGFTAFSFEVTYNGKDLSSGQALIYIALFGVIFFIFGMNIFFINKLPSQNQRDEEGKIMSISTLKYAGSVLWFVEWMLIVAILYLSSNIAFSYLGEQLFAKILFAFFNISLGITPLIAIIWISWIVVKIIQDKEMKILLERGIYPQHRL